MTYPDNLQIWSKYHANNIKRKVGTLDICPFFWGEPFCCRRATIRNGDTTGMTGPKVACPSSAVWLARCSFYREKCAEGDAAQRTRQVYEEALKILGLHPGGGDGRMVIWMVVEWERRHGRVVNTLMGCIYVCIYIYIFAVMGIIMGDMYVSPHWKRRFFMLGDARLPLLPPCEIVILVLGSLAMLRP